VRPQKKKILPRWPADKVERWALDRLVPYARNARTHSDEQVGQVAASIREWGWTTPVLVGEDGGIIAGHCRVLAATKLGLAEVPVMIAAGWSEAQKRAYVLADNQLALNAGWNPELLKLELGELQGLGFDLGVIGFDEAQLAALSGNPGLTDPDEVPEVPADPVTRAGDLWVFGRHRLLCGDATNAEDVRQLMAGTQAQLVFTDPPYGVDYSGGAKKRKRLNGDHLGTDIYGAALPHLRFAADDNAALYLWYADGHAGAGAGAAAAAGYQIVAQVIWAKNHAQFVTSAHYKGKHEPCFYAHRRGQLARWYGPNNEVTLWEANRSPRNDWHPTQKPVELAERAIRNSSAANDIVLDLFVGGGTTIIAAEMTGRACCAIEIDPAYVDVCIMRWQAFTGERATLDGHPFDDIAVERRQETAA
jgi:DNA modification methylase